ALLILQNVANANKYPITPQGIANGDVVDNGGGLTGQDALALQMIDAKLLTQGQLPVKASDLTK
ncbi:MAG TPA: cellulose 1,4-beta-cellobiosidase, partial [Ruminococcus flavefaciens]|nr:cellulose 1,4-beta-cellobiosidase [Ruminococcus flavefaciens]